MDGPMDGTSIQELINQKMENNKQQSMMNVHQMSNAGIIHEQGHNSTTNVVEGQHAPYYNIPNNTNYPQHTTQCSGQECKQRQIQKDIQDIDALAQDISDNLPSDLLLTGVSDAPKEKDKKEKKNNKFFPKFLLDPLIIIVVFIVLSQPYIKNIIGKYVKFIKPRDDGTVPFVGILIYGVILAVIYSLIKKALVTYVF
jgi:hypothetical protein